MKYSIEILNEEIFNKKDFILPFTLDRQCGIWRNKNNEIIALMQGKSIDDVETSDIHIEFFEVKEKENGYGRDCIYSLFNLYPNLQEIKGESEENAIFFWKNIGAFFINYCEDCDNLSSCEENGYCCNETESKDFTLTREDIL